MSETIFALSTARGRAGLAVVRVSGRLATHSAQLLSRRTLEPRVATFCTLANPDSRETIDEGVVTYFAAPASYTGEDVVEYAVHGGKAVIQSLLDALSHQEGHRMAEPGEFTRRAFGNGKLDLTEAEAVADLIDAETTAQRNQALAQLSGQLSVLYHGWSERLSRMLAHVEADIEFPDEDLPDGVAAQVAPEIRKMLQEIVQHLSDNRRGERLRDGLQVVVIGAPNAGKSSLVNAIAQRDVAIVSEVAGTTRDVLEVHLDLGGYPVNLVDTAGLRPEHVDAKGHDMIENEGMRRALERAGAADIRVLVFDGALALPDERTLELIDEDCIVLMNKADQNLRFALPGGIPISAQSGAGVEDFMKALLGKAEKMIGRSEAPSLTRQRHRAAPEDCSARLNDSLEAQLPELIAEDLRLAMRAIDRITGKTHVEDLLTTIFLDFCVGK